MWRNHEWKPDAEILSLQPTEWSIKCVEKSTGFLRSFVVIGSREDAEWHFRNTECTARWSPTGWVPKLILPNL
jgi:hypothetical protein